jgi:hypothetical protein
MHLLLGDPSEAFCLGVRDGLAARGCDARIVANPLTDSWHFSWWLDTARSRSSVGWNDQMAFPDDAIAGVLVLSPGWIDPTGWQPADVMYVESERQAALLAWLWSLACPVVNRYLPAVWYRPHAPLLSWHGLLRRSGLPTLEIVVTNVEQEAHAFRERLAADGLDGLICGVLTSEARYLVASDDDWSGLAALQRVTPVCLSSPHGETQSVCVVGDHVVWDGETRSEAVQLESALRAFASAAGLALVELALASTSKGICVVGVETRPRLEHFGVEAQQEIVDGIVRVLTGDKRGPALGG